jgi:hypothetical protein
VSYSAAPASPSGLVPIVSESLAHSGDIQSQYRNLEHQELTGLEFIVCSEATDIKSIVITDIRFPLSAQVRNHNVNQQKEQST